MAFKVQVVDTDRDALTNAAAVTLTPPAGTTTLVSVKTLQSLAALGDSSNGRVRLLVVWS
jgi:hypothetical protein